MKHWTRWLFAAAAGMLTWAWLADYVRRRVRAQQIFAHSQKRVARVNVTDVIERELHDELWREEIFAQLPAHTRYYEMRRYEWIWQLLPRDVHAAKVLDAGCGDGYILQETAKRWRGAGARFFGMDISFYKTARAQQRLGASAHINVANLERTPFPDNTFDLIVCTEVLEHLLHVQPGITELWRILKPGGRLLLSTPSRHPVYWSYANPFTWLEAFVGLFFPAALPPFHNLEHPDDPHSVVHRAFTQQELQNELRAFENVTILSTSFRLPTMLYRTMDAPEMWARIETLRAQIPLWNRLGETLLVCAVKP